MEANSYKLKISKIGNCLMKNPTLVEEHSCKLTELSLKLYEMRFFIYLSTFSNIRITIYKL